MVSSVSTQQDAAAAYSPPPDTELEQLIAACAAKDSRALRRLYDLTSPQLLACMVRILKRRALAEEALQDVFVSIWQRASQYETRRGRARAWLVSIARHRAIDVLRQERAELYRETEIDELPQLVVEGGTDWSTAGRSSAALQRCFELLSIDQRRGIELAYVDGYSHSDIARAIGQPLGTVKSWIRRGLASLRQCLEQ
jgi:RNA polymerase sigma factor (sigma-70 family)